MSNPVRAPLDGEPPAPIDQEVAESEPAPQRNFWLKLLYSQNPFYLLSVCFVLHGTSYWFQQGDLSQNPWPLMAVIIGYILMLAATAFVLVRYGNVWDDARSIFLLLPVMFVELALTFDDILISDKALGTTLLFAGFAVSSIVIEGLLIGLRMKMPAAYRIPIHVMLALLFLYPVFVVSGGFPENDEVVAWKIYWFASLAAFALLALIPAIRRGPSILQNNGTPWTWPLYPWSLMTFLGIGLAARSYALSLSFDPFSTDPNNLQGTFDWYFMAPIVIALAVLILEAGIVRQRSSLRFIGVLLPIAAIYMSQTNAFGPSAQTSFLAMFMNEVGSPLHGSLIAAAIFYCVALARRVQSSEEFTMAVLWALCCVNPQTQQFTRHFELTTWPLFAIFTIQLIAAWHSKPSIRALRALFYVLVLAWSFSSNWPVINRTYVFSYALIATLLFVSVAFRDDFARRIRGVVSVLLVASCCCEPFVGYVFEIHNSWLTGFLHQTQLAVLSIICAYGIRSMAYFRGGIYCTGALLLNATVQYTLFVIAARNAYALGVISIGFAWFMLAAGISAAKARWIQRLWALISLPRQPDV